MDENAIYNVTNWSKSLVKVATYIKDNDLTITGWKTEVYQLNTEYECFT